MPVDDAEIDSMLDLANKKIESNHAERSKLKTFIVACTEIKKIPVDSEGTMGVKKDRYLGTKLADARRQAIYDKLITDKISLGL